MFTFVQFALYYNWYDFEPYKIQIGKIEWSAQVHASSSLNNLIIYCFKYLIAAIVDPRRLNTFSMIYIGQLADSHMA